MNEHQTTTKDGKTQKALTPTREDWHYLKPKLPDKRILNCSAVIAGNYTKLEYLRHEIYSQRTMTDMEFAKDVENCSRFRNNSFIKTVVSKEEVSFPIAYIITLHKNPIQVEHLLRAIYSSHNLYCIHVDKKAKDSVKQSMKNMAHCLSNVFIAEHLEEVQYAIFSRLKADVNCLKDLSKKNHSWRYAINLVGQDFPIKTNYEIVKYLKRLNGKNDIPGTLPTQQDIVKRYRFKHVYNVKNGTIRRKRDLKPPPPGNVTIYFGTAFFMASRAFIEYILSDKLAVEL